MDRNFSLCNILTLAFHSTGPNLSPNVGSQTSILNVLVHKPSR